MVLSSVLALILPPSPPSSSPRSPPPGSAGVAAYAVLVLVAVLMLSPQSRPQQHPVNGSSTTSNSTLSRLRPLRSKLKSPPQISYIPQWRSPKIRSPFVGVRRLRIKNHWCLLAGPCLWTAPPNKQLLILTFCNIIYYNILQYIIILYIQP